jgi:hypothetical protein
MAGAATTAAYVLAAVLLLAAMAKARQRSATAANFAALGLPAATLLSVAVPVAELLVAAGLIVRPAVGAYAAIMLLGAFTFVVIRAIASGADVGCGCFGGVTDSPVSPRDILRNGMLAGLAILATGTFRPVLPPAAPLVAVLASAAAGLAVLKGLDQR